MSDETRTLKFEGLTGESCVSCGASYERCNWRLRNDQGACCDRCHYTGTHNERSTEPEPQQAEPNSPSVIVQRVFDRWKREQITAWADGTYTPNEDQFAQMAVEAIELDRARR